MYPCVIDYSVFSNSKRVFIGYLSAESLKHFTFTGRAHAVNCVLRHRANLDIGHDGRWRPFTFNDGSVLALALYAHISFAMKEGGLASVDALKISQLNELRPSSSSSLIYDVTSIREIYLRGFVLALFKAVRTSLRASRLGAVIILRIALLRIRHQCSDLPNPKPTLYTDRRFTLGCITDPRSYTDCRSDLRMAEETHTLRESTEKAHGGTLPSPELIDNRNSPTKVMNSSNASDVRAWGTLLQKRSGACLSLASFRFRSHYRDS